MTIKKYLKRNKCKTPAVIEKITRDGLFEYIENRTIVFDRASLLINREEFYLYQYEGVVNIYAVGGNEDRYVGCIENVNFI